MKKKLGFIIGFIAIAAVASGIVWYLQGANVAVLEPEGTVADQQRDLLIFTTALSLIVVVPVFFLTAFIAWRYREGNKKATYAPDWDKNKWLEGVWWGIPCVIILVLAVVAWQTSHSLDPYRKLESPVKPVEVQVVALQWKWLFLYPEYDVASVNLVEIPTGTPINFSITADAPMNSFWIPSLGGQVYAMSGMSTKLHLMADRAGDYRGSSANISGEGFASMVFTARAVPRGEFDEWIDKARSEQGLDMASYEALAKPSKVAEPIIFSLKDDELYKRIVMKYMGSGHRMQDATEQTDEKMQDNEHMEGRH